MSDDDSLRIRVSGDLFDNSMDLFLDGIEGIKKRRSADSFFMPSPELKSALLAVTTGVELLLKAKIASIDWRQIFQNPQKSDRAKLLSGDFFSLKFEDCLLRLQDITAITFNSKTIDDIKEIRIIRNRLIHYHHNSEEDQILTLIVKAIGVYTDFYRAYIMEPFCEEKDQTRYIDRDLKDLKDYVKIRVAAIKLTLGNKPQPVTYHFHYCFECSQDVYMLKDTETILCCFCMQETDIKETAMSLSNFNESIKSCPKCNCNSMTALHKSLDEEEAWQCIICGHYINYPEIWGLGDKTHSTDSIREEFRNDARVLGLLYGLKK